MEAAPPDPYARRLRLLKRIGLGAIAVAVAGIVGIVVSVSTRSQSNLSGGIAVSLPQSLRGRSAPVDFTLARLGGGSRVSLAALTHGRPTVVNFFASWCPQCRAELDAFGEAWRSDRGKVTFVGIDTDDYDKAKALSLLRAAGADYTVGIDGSSDAVRDAFAVPDLPTTYFIDAAGRVRAEVVGAETRGTLQTRIDALLADRAGTG